MFLLVDVVEDGDQEVDDEDVGAEEVQGHCNRGHPPSWGTGVYKVP